MRNLNLLTDRFPGSGGLGCTDKQVILDTHNQLRQSVALGHVAGQPPAAGMREMVSDDPVSECVHERKWAPTIFYD